MKFTKLKNEIIFNEQRFATEMSSRKALKVPETNLVNWYLWHGMLCGDVKTNVDGVKCFGFKQFHVCDGKHTCTADSDGVVRIKGGGSTYVLHNVDRHFIKQAYVDFITEYLAKSSN